MELHVPHLKLLKSILLCLDVNAKGRLCEFKSTRQTAYTNFSLSLFSDIIPRCVYSLVQTP